MTRSIAPNSAIATFFRDLPDTLQQPAAIAMMGSLGAHLLFFATLPAFTPAESNPDREIRRVQVIDLPNNQSQTTPALRSPIGLPLPNLQNPQLKAGQSPPSSSLLVPPNPLYTVPDLNSPPSTTQQDWQRILEAAQRQQQRSIFVPKNPPPPPARSPQPTKPQPTQQPPTFNTETAAVPGLNNLNPSTQTPQDNPQPQPSPTTTPSPQLSRNDQLLAALRYNPEGTNFQEVQTTMLGNWFKGLSEKGITDDPELVRVRKLEDPNLEQPIPTLPYPLTFPLNNYKQHPAVVIVLVGKDGKPLGKPEILGSTGYPILNDAAIAAVEKRSGEYKPSERVRAYMYEFQFAPPANPNTASAPAQSTGN